MGSPLQTPPLRQRAPRGGLAAHWALAGAVGRRHPEQAVPSADAEPWAPGGGRRRGLWGPAEPTGSACGPRQKGFLTGLPSLSGPQTIDYPCTAASGSSPGLGHHSVHFKKKLLETMANHKELVNSELAQKVIM